MQKMLMSQVTGCKSSKLLRINTNFILLWFFIFSIFWLQRAWHISLMWEPTFPIQSCPSLINLSFGFFASRP